MRRSTTVPIRPSLPHPTALIVRVDAVSSNAVPMGHERIAEIIGMDRLKGRA